eukprot:augustus_masked-scaffold_15-processed-gene-9.38-mRNA-1 protein AED:1.00 eAED:1.00 QI:0/0/0/0/1/1/2/0/581
MFAVTAQDNILSVFLLYTLITEYPTSYNSVPQIGSLVGKYRKVGDLSLGRVSTNVPGTLGTSNIVLFSGENFALTKALKNDDKYLFGLLLQNNYIREYFDWFSLYQNLRSGEIYTQVLRGDINRLLGKYKRKEKLKEEVLAMFALINEYNQETGYRSYLYGNKRDASVRQLLHTLKKKGKVQYEKTKLDEERNSPSVHGLWVHPLNGRRRFIPAEKVVEEEVNERLVSTLEEHLDILYKGEVLLVIREMECYEKLKNVEEVFEVEGKQGRKDYIFKQNKMKKNMSNKKTEAKDEFLKLFEKLDPDEVEYGVSKYPCCIRQYKLFDILNEYGSSSDTGTEETKFPKELLPSSDEQGGEKINLALQSTIGNVIDISTSNPLEHILWYTYLLRKCAKPNRDNPEAHLHLRSLVLSIFICQLKLMFDKINESNEPEVRSLYNYVDFFYQNFFELKKANGKEKEGVYKKSKESEFIPSWCMEESRVGQKLYNICGIEYYSTMIEAATTAEIKDILLKIRNELRAATCKNGRFFFRAWRERNVASTLGKLVDEGNLGSSKVISKDWFVAFEKLFDRAFVQEVVSKHL